MTKQLIKTIKKISAVSVLLAFVVGSLGISTLTPVANAASSPTSTWDTTGSYIVNFSYQATSTAATSTDNMSLVQDTSDNLTGNGTMSAGTSTYSWIIATGTVVVNTINFSANSTATSTPQTVLNMTGTIASNGTISGTWSDNFQGGARAGTWSTASGTAMAVPAATSTVNVTISKYINGAMATASSSNNSAFQMSGTWNASSTGVGSGQYTLDQNATPTPYRAKTGEFSSGSNYSTNEIMNTTVGASCSTSTATTTPFSLVGYTTGDTMVAAASATPTLVMPTFTNMMTNKFVIVWNNSCPAINNGTGTLAVSSIDTVDSTATSDGTFANGWSYVFNITVPMNEKDVAMRFSDWVMTGNASNTIPAANNMRISSAQASSTATVLITAANVYSAPPLRMVTDLDPTLPGMQVKVTVEVAVPIGTANGTYTTNYGVRTE